MSGPDFNNTCKFPFRFKGVEYNKCTLVEASENKPWCSTVVDDNNNHVPNGGHYGVCAPTCPGKSSLNLCTKLATFLYVFL